MSALLCALWVRSLFVTDDLTWRRETSAGPNRNIWFFTLESGDGKLLIRDAAEIWSSKDFNPISSSPEQWKFEGHRATAPAESPQPWSTNPKTGPRSFVFTWEHSSATIDHEILTPIWLPLLILLLLAIFCFHRWRRGIRLPNHCPACGYDIRATPGRCPECGLGQRSSSDQ